jgi:SAM-dependent methyltransferase
VNPSLSAFYDARYEGVPTRVVEARAVPRDRHEACVRELARRLAGGDVLELGAGSGLVARSLVAAGADFARYTATERSAGALAGLRASLTDPRLHVAEADAEAVPEAFFGGFDAVVMVALVEHLVDPLAALARVRRCLRPGGFLYVDTPNVAKWTRRAKLLCGRFPATASHDEGLRTYAGGPVSLHDEGHLHYFTWRSLSRLLTSRCGFSRVERAPYAVGGFLGARLDFALARAWPELFAEIALVAHA